MAYYNSSSAYDLQAYPMPKRKEKPKLKMVKNKRRERVTVFNFRVLSSFGIVVLLLGVIIYNQVRLTEITDQVNTLTSELQLMESENVKMTSKLEATMNVRTIGEQAKTELGMSKLDQHQTVYIQLQQEDKVELTEHAPDSTLGQKVKSGAFAAIAKAKEVLAPLVE